MREMILNGNTRLRAIALAVVICAGISMLSASCNRSAPLDIEDLSITMPGDDTNQYDVYRVVAVKKGVTRQELVALMEYFTKMYLDKNRVMIYVFNSVGGAHLGKTENLIATYFQDKNEKKYVREILLDQPGKELE